MEIEKIKEFISELKDVRDKRSLSDEYLQRNDCTTREEIGVGGEYVYGIVLVPEDYVIDMVEALLEKIK